MHDSLDVTTIVFALLAVFVVWKLRSVLGTRTGAERPPRDPVRRTMGGARRTAEGSAEGNVVRMGAAAKTATPVAAPDPDRWQGFAEAGSPLWNGLDAVKAADPSFDVRAFVQGAKTAYEMIVTAFAKGDRETLRPLLSDDVFESFSQAITDRAGREETVEMTFVAIVKADPLDAQLKGRTAQITLNILSQLISATRNSAGAVIEGDVETVADVTDVWTFARDVSARDPNWRLVATEATH